MIHKIKYNYLDSLCIMRKFNYSNYFNLNCFLIIQLVRYFDNILAIEEIQTGCEIYRQRVNVKCVTFKAVRKTRSHLSRWAVTAVTKRWRLSAL